MFVLDRRVPNFCAMSLGLGLWVRDRALFVGSRPVKINCSGPIDWWGWVVSHPRRQESVFNSAGTEHAKRSRRFRGDNRVTLQDARGATLYRLNIGLEHRSLYLGMCVPRVLPRWESNHWGSNSLF